MEDHGPLSVKDVSAMLTRRGMKPACEACGSDKGWTVPNPSDEDKETVSRIVMMRDDTVLRHGSNPMYDFIPVICTNCGHTRFFLTSFLMRQGD